jgi:hypothetical protein
MLICLTATGIGCSRTGPRASVTGTVKYKNEPVKAGTVYFVYEQGGMYQCDLKPDGSFQFMDVPTGNVKVVVQTETFNPDQKPQSYTQKQKDVAKGYGKNMKEYDERMGKGAGESKDASSGLSKEQKEALAKVYVKIPEKYRNESTTPLTYTVDRGRRVKDFDLSD